MKKMVCRMVITLGFLLLLSQVVDASDAQTDYETGERYYNSQNYVEALKWFHKAADKGHTDAQSSLVFMYFNGQGVTRDYQEALKWSRILNKAINQ